MAESAVTLTTPPELVRVPLVNPDPTPTLMAARAPAPTPAAGAAAATVAAAAAGASATAGRGDADEGDEVIGPRPATRPRLGASPVRAAVPAFGAFSVAPRAAAAATRVTASSRHTHTQRRQGRGWQRRRRRRRCRAACWLRRRSRWCARARLVRRRRPDLVVRCAGCVRCGRWLRSRAFAATPVVRTLRFARLPQRRRLGVHERASDDLDAAGRKLRPSRCGPVRARPAYSPLSMCAASLPAPAEEAADDFHVEE